MWIVLIKNGRGEIQKAFGPFTTRVEAIFKALDEISNSPNLWYETCELSQS